MAEHETTADIIAEMRKTKYGDAECEVKWCLTQWADRLEATNKRERGDCAKMREALENLYDQICHGETEQHVAANRQMIRAALAAPPRNCDMFATKIDAKHKWEKVCEAGLPEQGPFEDWIFALATKGGKE